MAEKNLLLVDELKERIKELTCLYEISNIATSPSKSLTDKIQAIIEVLPKAWQHPDQAIAELLLDNQFFSSMAVPDHTISQKHPIVINQENRGYLAIHYVDLPSQPLSFLHEEDILLKTIAQEVSGIIDRIEQKQREEVLQRKFEHSDRLTILGEITAGIAHELNTPLGNILGFSQLIQDRVVDKQVRHDIEKIISSALHSREVVKKLMFFSCEMPQRMQHVAVNPLIEDALQLLKITLKNAQVEAHFSPDVADIHAQVDPVQFTQVVFNLLINAIHASGPGQKIMITLESDDKDITLHIEDHGYGITDEIKERIFEPFFSTKSTGEGSGLGLSVVYGIVKSHSGVIKVSSSEHLGSTFTVVLPLSQKQ